MAPIELERHVRDIRGVINEYPNFVVVHKSETRVSDVIDSLHKERPEIVHFVGHGGNGLICLTDDRGARVVLTGKELGEIIKTLPVKPIMAVLSACHSAVLLNHVRKWVDVAIGFKDRVTVDTSRDFSAALYRHLGRDASIETAFSLACIDVGATNSNLFKMKPREGSDLGKIVFHGTPEIMAEFEMKAGAPVHSGLDYSILLRMRGVDKGVDAVTYQVCDRGFKKKERFWEVRREDSADFFYDDLETYGDVTLRATAWWGTRGVGVETTLAEALLRHYGQTPDAEIALAIGSLRKHRDE
jgi:hypothetical protein